MSDETPETPVEPIPVEPVPAAPAPAELQDGAVASAQPDATADAEPVAERAEPTAVEFEPQQEVVAGDTVNAAPTSEQVAPEAQAEPETAPSAPVQTVYVHAPVPPQRRGNRGIGSLIALGSAVIFAILYAGVVLAVVPLFAPPRAVGFEFLSFIGSAAFFVPVLVFAAAFILLVLIANRAGWWAYILGSLVVGLLVYFVSIGILLLVNGIIGFTPSEALKAFRSALQAPVTILAGLVGREVALWMGAAVAARGRRVRARNAEAQAAYDRDTARARADYERAVAANAAH